MGWGPFPGKDGAFDTTVLTSGKEPPHGCAIFIIHFLTWTAAIGLSSAAAVVVEEDTSTNAASKRLAWLIVAVNCIVVAAIAAHAALVKKEYKLAPLASAFLIAFVILSNTFTTALMAYSMMMEIGDAYSLTALSSAWSALGSAMVIAFWVEFTHHGNLT